MAKKFEFNIRLEADPDGEDRGYFIVPPAITKEIGKRGLVKIKATFDGVEYRGSLMPMGDGTHCLGLRKDVQKKVGKGPGDTIYVTLEEDTEERVVEIPAELEAIFKRNKKAREFFDSLSYTNRKEYARWIADAKKEETKLARLKKTEEMLLKGVKHP